MTTQLTAAAAPGDDDVAIVGMACLFPRADSIESFWENIVQKVDCIGDAPPDWQPELFYDPTGRNSDKSYTQRGGFLGDLSRFNSLKYGVPPTDIEGAEPDHFLALRCAFEAMADAGYPEIPLNRDKMGVIVGRGIFVNRGIIGVFQRLLAVDQVIHLLRQLEPDRDEEEFAFLRSELKRELPPLNADTFPGLVHSALVGRIANRLDLHGPAYTIDAACASVLLAMEHGVRELRAGRCDAVMIGGSQVSIPAAVQIGFCTVEALSRQGKVAPFSAEASGTLLGQGCGMLIIKRYRDAVRDGNRIYALVKGVGSSSDGKGAGVLAPLTEGQQLAIRRAYQDADCDPATIELIEAHATGIPLGDATEMTTITACFGERDGVQANVAIGSVKSMIGHLVPASGAASIIKTALALYHRVLPPTLHARQPHAQLGIQSSRFYLCHEPQPWLHSHARTPRRAGINAFGFGGINAHLILEEEPGDESQLPRYERNWPAELVVVSAANRGQLIDRLKSVLAWMGASREIRLRDIAASCAQQRGSCRLAIVAKDVPELTRKLQHAAGLLTDRDRQQIQDRRGIYWYDRPLAREGTVAFVFPGEGSQYVNMHAELCRNFPVVRQQFDLTDQAFRHWCGQSLGQILFPQQEEASTEARLLEMEIAVAVVTASGRGLLALLTDFGVTADAVVGHSSGEFAAVLASGAFEPESDQELIETIVNGIQSTFEVARSELVAPAVLTTVGGVEPGAVRRVLAAAEGKLVFAMDNCPHQIVLVGDEEATSNALQALKGHGGLCTRIPWNRPYHTEAAAPICQFVEKYVQSLKIGSPKTPLWSCVTAQRCPPEGDAIKQLAVQQWRSKVRFRETIQAMHEDGCRVFVELGPRGNLSAFVADTLAGKPHAAIPLDIANTPDITQLCRALGMLVAHGIPVRLDRLFSQREARIYDLDAEPPCPTKPDPPIRLDLPTLELDDDALRTLRRSSVTQSAGVPVAAAKPTHEDTAPLATDEALTCRAQPTADAARRAAAIVDFQQTMQRFLTTQRNVMTTRTAARRESQRMPNTNGGTRQSATLRGGSPTAAPSNRGLPIEIVELKWNERLIAHCEFDLARDRFLLDHTFFGRRISDSDPELHALPVMPLAVMLELMAEGAVRLMPTAHLQALTRIEARRWLCFEKARRRIRLEATANTPSSVRVVLSDAEDSGEVLVTGTVELNSEPATLAAPLLPDRSEQPPPWRPEDLYGNIVYHGPAFQGIECVEQWSRRGIRARVRNQPATAASNAALHDLILPVQLIDTASQIPGLVYTNYQQVGTTCRLAFPTSIERIEVASDAGSTDALVAVAVCEEDGQSLRSDVEIATPMGETVLRCLGRVEEGIDIPLSIYRYAFEPHRVWCSEDITDLFADAALGDAVTVCVSGSDANRLYLQRMWGQVLARMILSRVEREDLLTKQLTPVATASWLLRRVVAKDAARLRRGRRQCMADVMIQADGRTAYDVDQPTNKTRISLAQHGLFSVAAAADGQQCCRLGIDVLPVVEPDPSVVASTLKDSERHLLRHPDCRNAVALAAGMAAKKAIGKSVGVKWNLLDVQLTDFDPSTGRCSATLNKTDSSVSEDSNWQSLEVCWRLHKGHVVALYREPAKPTT